jgi:hypothetical protein
MLDCNAWHVLGQMTALLPQLMSQYDEEMAAIDAILFYFRNMWVEVACWRSGQLSPRFMGHHAQ